MRRKAVYAAILAAGAFVVMLAGGTGGEGTNCGLGGRECHETTAEDVLVVALIVGSVAAFVVYRIRPRRLKRRAR